MIESEHDGDIVIHTASDSVSLGEISAYIDANIGGYATKQVIWDLSAINFYTITSAMMKAFMTGNSETTAIRKGRRTAILLSDETGVGKMRSLQQILDGSRAVKMKVFNSQAIARQWLADG